VDSLVANKLFFLVKQHLLLAIGSFGAEGEPQKLQSVPNPVTTPWRQRISRRSRKRSRRRMATGM